MADDKGGQASTETADDKGQQQQAAGEKPGEKAGEKPAASQTADDGKGGAGKEAATGKESETGKGKEAAKEAAPKAPEKYSLNTPDGGADVLADIDMQYLEEVARANDWTNEEAQQELDALVKRQVERNKTIGAKLLETVKADTDFGGDKFEATQASIKKAIDRVLPEGHTHRAAFLALLNRPTVGNQLPVVAFLATLGSMLGDDSPAHARSTMSGGTTKDAAKTFYDHPTSQRAQKEGEAQG